MVTRLRSITRLFKLIVLAFLLYIIYFISLERSFQKYLGDSRIAFDDFPLEYVQALNSSRAEGREPSDFDYNATFSSTPMPRLIHFIWFQNLYEVREGNTQIPSIGSRAPELCRKHNPDYEIRMWNSTDARDFLSTHYPWFMETYDGYRYPIQRIDALKYFVLYHFGGIYMDLDISCRRPLDPLLTFDAWFPEASPLGVNNDLMAARPRHPIFGAMTAELQSNDINLLFPYLTIFWTTGPRYASNILKQWYLNHDSRKSSDFGQDDASDGFRVLPQIFYSEAFTFFGHSPGGTWHGGDVAVILWLVDRPWLVVGVVLSTCVLLILKKGRDARVRARAVLDHEKDLA